MAWGLCHLQQCSQTRASWATPCNASHQITGRKEGSAGNVARKNYLRSILPFKQSVLTSGWAKTLQLWGDELLVLLADVVYVHNPLGIANWPDMQQFNANIQFCEFPQCDKPLNFAAMQSQLAEWRPGGRTRVGRVAIANLKAQAKVQGSQGINMMNSPCSGKAQLGKIQKDKRTTRNVLRPPGSRPIVFCTSVARLVP